MLEKSLETVLAQSLDMAGWKSVDDSGLEFERNFGDANQKMGVMPYALADGQEVHYMVYGGEAVADQDGLCSALSIQATVNQRNVSAFADYFSAMLSSEEVTDFGLNLDETITKYSLQRETALQLDGELVTDGILLSKKLGEYDVRIHIITHKEEVEGPMSMSISMGIYDPSKNDGDDSIFLISYLQEEVDNTFPVAGTLIDATFPIIDHYIENFILENYSQRTLFTEPLTLNQNSSS